MKGLFVALALAVAFGCGLLVGEMRQPKTVIRTQPKVEWEHQFIECIDKDTADLAKCTNCDSLWSPRWSAHMVRLYVRNCFDPFDPVIAANIDSWNRGDFD